MGTKIIINDRLTWVVAAPGQPQTGEGITPDVSLPIIPTKEEEWILKSTSVLWEKSAKKIEQVKLPDREQVGEILVIIGACLQPLLIFAASVGEVLVSSMLSSICL
jgi:hypothetical protein